MLEVFQMFFGAKSKLKEIFLPLLARNLKRTPPPLLFSMHFLNYKPCMLTKLTVSLRHLMTEVFTGNKDNAVSIVLQYSTVFIIINNLYSTIVPSLRSRNI